jgi:biopolymer transport protein ExbD
MLFEEIEPALQAIVAQKKENEEVNVLLQADKTLNLQDVINVIDVGNAVKVKMVLFTQKDK